MARPKSTPERPLPEALSTPCERFLKAMERDNGLAANTLDAYRRDLNRYLHHPVSYTHLTLPTKRIV